MRAEGWRKVASATWRGPLDPQIYGDLELDAAELLAFIQDARAATGVHVTVTHLVGRALAHAVASEQLAAHGDGDLRCLYLHGG